MLLISTCRWRSEWSGLALLEEACACGSNPHCHFIFLLESISFDHSFLLDLLISVETCFLQYLVQYLKCLIADWQSFRLACGRMSTASDSKTLPASFSAHNPSLTCTGAIQPCEISSCVPAHPPDGSFPPLEMSISSHGLHLVDYSSSDDSDHDNVNITEDNPGLKVLVTQTQIKTSHSAGFLKLLPDLKVGPDKTSDGPCEISARVLGCLSELRDVVMRLHTKKLFPYNPASLLKLLGHVEERSLQSPE